MNHEDHRSIWPRSRALRFLAFLWALPAALIGATGAGLFALLGWVRPTLSAGALDLVCSGPFARWMAHRHWAAFTFAVYIWYWTPAAAVDPRIRRHEREHVRQFLRWGPLMLLAYPIASAWAAWQGGDAYHDNFFEQEAWFSPLLRPDSSAPQSRESDDARSEEA